MGWHRVTHRQLVGVGVAVVLWTTTVHAASTSRVVTVGANLTKSQRQTVLRDFGSVAVGARQIIINHGDEERLLSGVAPQSQIGTRSISSSAVAMKSRGYGIQVTTHDITWVTPSMYANALATAGVKNAEVIADAPFPVSGTAALAGILTAYQSASGTTIPFGQQRTAAKERSPRATWARRLAVKPRRALSSCMSRKSWWRSISQHRLPFDRW